MSYNNSNQVSDVLHIQMNESVIEKFGFVILEIKFFFAPQLMLLMVFRVLTLHAAENTTQKTRRARMQ